MSIDIDDILNSSIDRATAPEHLFDGIMLRVKPAKRVPRRFIWAAAASIALLIAINYGALKQASHQDNSYQNFRNEYFPNTSLNLF
jgi:hypothetical protein